MNQYYVLWTYIANFSRLITIKADNAEEARKLSCGFFSEDFAKKATVFIFETPPAIIQYKGEKMGVDAYREASRGE